MIKVNLLDSVTERSQSSAAAVEAKVANPAARFWMLGAAVGVLLGLAMLFDFYRATADENEAAVQRILISGGGSKLKGLPEFLAQRFEIPVERLDPFRRIGVDARRFDPDYMREVVPEMAVAVGLALRGVEA